MNVPVDHVENFGIDFLLHPLLLFFELSRLLFDLGHVCGREVIRRSSFAEVPETHIVSDAKTDVEGRSV